MPLSARIFAFLMTFIVLPTVLLVFSYILFSPNSEIFFSIIILSLSPTIILLIIINFFTVFNYEFRPSLKLLLTPLTLASLAFFLIFAESTLSNLDLVTNGTKTTGKVIDIEYSFPRSGFEYRFLGIPIPSILGNVYAIPIVEYKNKNGNTLSGENGGFEFLPYTYNIGQSVTVYYRDKDVDQFGITNKKVVIDSFTGIYLFPGIIILFSLLGIFIIPFKILSSKEKGKLFKIKKLSKK